MKTYRLIMLVLVVIIILPFSGRLFWLIKKSKPIDIVIINKSVQTSSQNEVKSLNWLLNFEKFVDYNEKPYDFHHAYLGYYPDALSEDRKIKSYKLEEVSVLAENNDALFFIDNSGVELNQGDKANHKNLSYSGFNQNDYSLLKEMLGKQKLVIAEYNFFSPPTEELVRYNTEQLLDTYSLGWSGKYFEDLAEENASGLLSENWFELYKQNYSLDWNFNGPGIVLINHGQNRIIVFPSREFMTAEYPEVISSPEIAAEYGIPVKVSYSGWFDVAFQGKNKIISKFNLNLNQEGKNILKSNGIESVFPAVIESPNKKFYYMAGDFSKSRVCLSSCRLGFISRIIQSREKKMTQNPDKFFQTYYNYLLSDILNTYYMEIANGKRK